MGKITFPLDPEALEAADDEFYRRHPEMAPGGKREPLHGTSQEHAAMRKEWMEIYLEMLEKVQNPDDEDDDNTDPIDPINPCPDDDDPCMECQPIVSVDLFSVTYGDDHAKLKNHDADWKNAGSLYKEPEWTAAGVEHPITVTMDKVQKLKIEYTVSDEDACPESGSVAGESGGKTVAKGEGASFAPSATPTSLAVKSAFKFAKKITDTSLSIDWTAHADADHAMGTSKNRVFVIFGPSKDGKFREDGATLKRMEAAVRWASAAGSIDEFEIVKYLFEQFDRYVLGIEYLTDYEREVLETYPHILAELTKYDWPTYFDDAVGAWPMADLQIWGGECQAICRFIRGIMRQIGSKDKLEFITYSADFSDPETPLAQSKPTGPRADREYGLADAHVQRLKTYWEPLPGEAAEVGWNNFEAYLKYTPSGGGKMRLFGGGVGLLEEGRNPLDVFDSIVEYRWRWRKKKLPNGTEVDQAGRYITRLHRYDNTKPWP